MVSTLIGRIVFSSAPSAASRFMSATGTLRNFTAAQCASFAGKQIYPSSLAAWTSGFEPEGERSTRSSGAIRGNSFVRRAG